MKMTTNSIISHPDLLKLCENDYKYVINGFQKFAKDIFDGNDENQKKALLENLLDLVKYSEIARPVQSAKSMKRPLEVKDEVKNEPFEENVAKKPKHDPGRNVDVPYDIWLKIMNYLDTKDLFKNFNLACRKFNFMSMDSNAVKYLTLSSIKKETDFKMATKVIRRSKLLVEIKIDQCSKYWKTLMLEALKKPKLKSIKIQNSTSDVAFPGDKVKNLGGNLEHLDLQEVKFSDNILIEIAKIKTLKSLANIWIGQNVLPTITEHCYQLESITIDATYGMKPVLDQFFQERGKTLKILTIHGAGGWSTKEENLLENINFCENLEYLSLIDFGRQITEETMIDLPKLKRLQMKRFHAPVNDIEYLFKNMNRSNLKEIFLENIFNSFTRLDVRMVQTIATLDFPHLEHFFTRSNGNLDLVNQDSINAMVENCPNLKSIQLLGRCDTGLNYKNPSSEFMEDLCFNRGIYVDFRYTDMNQIWLENYLKKQTPTVRRKYLNMQADLPQFRSVVE